MAGAAQTTGMALVDAAGAVVKGKAMNCDCITRINEKLSEQNLALDTLFLLDQGKSTLAIGTHFKDKDKRKRGERPTNLLVTFCPFCSERATTEQQES